MIWIVIYILLQLGDVVTTEYNLKHGCIEANPIYRKSKVFCYIVKTVLIFVIYFISLFLSEFQFQIILIFIFCELAYFPIHNLIQVIR